MRETVDYQIDILIFGSAMLPADWVYNGKYKAGEVTTNTFGMTLVRGDGRNILIDTGSNMEDPEKQSIYFGIYHAEETMGSPQDALSLVGLTPDDITDVVITHAHMDHIGALELFPNAHFYMQGKELEAWEEVARDPKLAPSLLPGVATLGDLERARKLVDEGRMTLLEGSQDNILPGIDVRAFHNAHSVVDQVVVIHTPDGDYVDAGDILTREAHILGIDDEINYYTWQSNSAGSQYLTMKTYPEIMALAGNDIEHVILRHDSTYAESKSPQSTGKNTIRYKLR